MLYFFEKRIQEKTFFVGNITLYSNTDHLSDQTRVD